MRHARHSGGSETFAKPSTLLPKEELKGVRRGSGTRCKPPRAAPAPLDSGFRRNDVGDAGMTWVMPE